MLDSWSFPDEYLGKPVLAEVYTDADLVVFFLNEKEVAKVTPAECIARTTVPYEKGTLSVKAYRNGTLLGEDVIETVSAPAKVSLRPEQEEILADGRSLCYVDIVDVDNMGYKFWESTAKRYF